MMSLATSPLTRYIAEHALPPPTPEQEQALIKSFLNGDEQAGRELLLRFGRLVMAVVHHIMRAYHVSPEYGEELLMDSLETMYYSAKSYDPSIARFSTYLQTNLIRMLPKRLARHNSWYKQEKSVLSLDEIRNLEDPVHPYDSILDHLALSDALNAIEHQGVMLLLAKNVGKQPLSTIAQDYCLTISQVQRRIHMATVLLRSYLLGAKT